MSTSWDVQNKEHATAIEAAKWNHIVVAIPTLIYLYTPPTSGRHGRWTWTVLIRRNRVGFGWDQQLPWLPQTLLVASNMQTASHSLLLRHFTHHVMVVAMDTWRGFNDIADKQIRAMVEGVQHPGRETKLISQYVVCARFHFTSWGSMCLRLFYFPKERLVSRQHVPFGYDVQVDENVHISHYLFEWYRCIKNKGKAIQWNNELLITLAKRWRVSNSSAMDHGHWAYYIKHVQSYLPVHFWPRTQFHHPIFKTSNGTYESGRVLGLSVCIPGIATEIINDDDVIDRHYLDGSAIHHHHLARISFSLAIIFPLTYLG